MAENRIECTTKNMFDEGNKGKNESDSDKDEEKGKKGFWKFEKKYFGNVKKNNNNNNKGNMEK